MTLIKKHLHKMKMLLKATLHDYKYNKTHFELYCADTKEHQFATLRMYCHMMDKALNNPLFEKGHSMKVYREAKSLSEELKQYYSNDSAFFWTQCILEHFEKAQDNGSPEIIAKNAIEYTEEEKKLIKKFILSRTSCRNFKKEYIQDDIVKDIVMLAADAPNGCCRQTTRFYITQDEVKINSLVPNVAGITNFTNIQGLVAVCAESSFYSLVDKNLQYVDASLSAENFILAASMHGVYGTMCNFFHAAPEQIQRCKKILSIKKSENIVMFIAIGYPTNIPQKPVRHDYCTFLKIV